MLKVDIRRSRSKPSTFYTKGVLTFINLRVCVIIVKMNNQKCSFCSHVGHHSSQIGPLHLPVRCSLSLRPWHRVPSDHRDLRALAEPRLRALHDHVHQKHISDRIRSLGPRDRHVRQHRWDSKVIQVKFASDI